MPRTDDQPADSLHDDSSRSPVNPIVLKAHDGVKPRPVLPSPVFHGRRIPVTEGYIDLDDIVLWQDNERLTIHVNQFHNIYDRAPDPDELLAIMQSTTSLAGLDENDQFRIMELAASIAANGVRTPPVIAQDGKLLDGNRRIAACHQIMNNDRFTTEEKNRAKTIRVWQLTDSSSKSDEEAVVISLNFEPDYKQDWPEYVKARKVYDAWRAILDVEVSPTPIRLKGLRGGLARRFALSTDRLNRYIAMVDLAQEFEDYQTLEKQRDEFEVQHKSERYFQYFDEMGKGRSPGGVNYTMNQDDTFKNLVFDLTYDGKFRNFAQIRELRHAYHNDEAMDILRDARGTSDRDHGQELVDDALSVSRTARAIERKVGGNKRIEAFVDWLLAVPVSFFDVGRAGSVTAINLNRLYLALKLVEGHLPEDSEEDEPASEETAA